MTAVVPSLQKNNPTSSLLSEDTDLSKPRRLHLGTLLLLLHFVVEKLFQRRARMWLVTLKASKASLLQDHFSKGNSFSLLPFSQLHKPTAAFSFGIRLGSRHHLQPELFYDPLIHCFWACICFI